MHIPAPDSPLGVFYFSLDYGTADAPTTQHQLFGVDVALIQEIVQVKRSSFTSIPLAKLPFKGIVSVYSQSVVLVDLKYALGFGEHTEREDLVLLVVKHKDRVIGFPIADPGDIINLTWGDVKPLDFAIQRGGHCLHGLVENPENGRAISFLATEQLLERLECEAQPLAA
jgi:chemotaxis signal transduction protein